MQVGNGGVCVWGEGGSVGGTQAGIRYQVSVGISRYLLTWSDTADRTPVGIRTWMVSGGGGLAQGEHRFLIIPFVKDCQLQFLPIDPHDQGAILDHLLAWK